MQNILRMESYKAVKRGQKYKHSEKEAVLTFKRSHVGQSLQLSQKKKNKSTKYKGKGHRN